MQRTIESSPAHSQIVMQFQSMFPSVALPHIDPNSSFFDSLNSIIRTIPRPSAHDRMQTIHNMKNYVDGQQLRIQMNMIEIEEGEPMQLHEIVKKTSIETRDSDDSWDEAGVENEHNWDWQVNELAYQESLHQDFPSFLD